MELLWIFYGYFVVVEMWVVGFEIGCGRGSDFNWLASITANEYRNMGGLCPFVGKADVERDAEAEAEAVNG